MVNSANMKQGAGRVPAADDNAAKTGAASTHSPSSRSQVGMPSAKAGPLPKTKVTAPLPKTKSTSSNIRSDDTIPKQVRDDAGPIPTGSLSTVKAEFAIRTTSARTGRVHDTSKLVPVQSDMEAQRERLLQKELSGLSCDHPCEKGSSRYLKHQPESSGSNVLRGVAGCFILLGLACFLLAVKDWLFPSQEGSPHPTGAASKNQSAHSRRDDGFCCWRLHPLPYYHGHACKCPIEHRSYYECPPEGCTDHSGKHWQRGYRLPVASNKAHCESSKHATWCHKVSSATDTPIAGPFLAPTKVRTQSPHSKLPQKGFCCWRDHPIPFYTGDPCDCPPKHRGDFHCPPEGCTDKSLAVWKRGSFANHYHVCVSKAGISAWCSASRHPRHRSRRKHVHLSKHEPHVHHATAHNSAASAQPKHAPALDGFCCWRDHPLPYYSGDPCVCPMQHRGYYECPPGGCQDEFGATWKRGSTFPLGNTQGFCQDPKNTHIASWCAHPGVPTPKSGPSLFCWTVIQASSSELALLRDHFRQRENIFACDDYLVISDEKVAIGDVSVWSLGPFNSKRAYDVAVFMRAWNAIFADGRYKKYDWIVKMDADTVFRATALREKLDFHNSDARDATYWENANGSAVNVSFNFFGPLEVYSRTAVEKFSSQGPHLCPLPMAHIEGEDAWMNACMKKLNVTPKTDFSLLESACTECPKLPALACATCKYAAFHPFKDIGEYRECSRLLSSNCDSYLAAI